MFCFVRTDYRLSSVVRVLLAIQSAVALAHEKPATWPTREQLEEVQPAIANSIPFSRDLVSHLRHRLNAGQLHLLDELSHELQVLQRVEAGLLSPDRGATRLEKAQLVDYFRWRTEQQLTDLLNSLSGDSVVELDFRDGLPEHSPDQPILIDASDNAVLLRVRAGSATGESRPIGLSVGKWDLIRERPLQHFSAEIASTGTSYVLLDLQRLPSDLTTSHLALNDNQTGKTLFTYALTFKAEPNGLLALDVIDEFGESTPVLMSIASHATGHLREPAEAVDLRIVLNDVVPHLSTSGRGYMFYLPGERRGRYWVVKPPLEMPLPQGKWDIKVLRGLEFSPIKKTISVEAGEWTRLELQPKRWTNMSSDGWYSGDDHVHAQLLTSEDARKLLDYTRAVDINIANILEMGDVMRTYYPQRGFGESFRVQHGDHWLVPGQEDPRSVLGHAIGLNLKSKVRDLDRYLSNDWIAEQIHGQGGLYGHTHVGANACFAHREMALFTPLGFVDFNSVMQSGLGTELYYDFLNLGFKMTASAGADTPYGGTIGAVRTYAHTGNSEGCNADEWFDAVRQGRTFVTNGPMLELRINDAMPGDELIVEPGQKLTLKAKTWGDSGKSSPQRLSIVKLGESINEVVATEGDKTQLNLDMSLHAEEGFWIAAHAVSHDGAEAHTTPIYVKCKGFRHWNVDRADQLIDRQLDVLREIELEIEQAERRYKNERQHLDYWTRRTVDQAQSLRERVNATRKIYEELRQTLSEELTRRN